MSDAFKSAGRGLPVFALVRTFAGVVMPLVLASCGGGGGGGSSATSTPAPSTPAPSATAPSITSQPAPQTASLGGTATFTAAASGTPTPTYQWARSNDRGQTWSAIQGATGASYTLGSVSLDDDNARFLLVAINSQGNGVSNDAVLSVTGALGQATNIATPPAAPVLDMTTGPDGNVWMTSKTGGTIEVFNNISRVFTSVTLPNPACNPLGITAGPDGRMWFAEQATATIGAISLDGTSIKEYPAMGAGPTGITTGPDGALWYTLQSDNLIGRMSAAGSATTFPVATANASPMAITLSPDGNLWFTEAAAGQIAKLTPAGSLTEWVIPTPSGGAKPSPQGLLCTSGGAIWFADAANGQVVQFTPPAAAATGSSVRGGLRQTATLGTGGTFQSVALAAGSVPVALTQDAGGNLWAADQANGQVVQVTPEGVARPFALPSTSGQAAGVTIGSDGSLFVAQPGNGTIGQVLTAAPSAAVNIIITPATLQTTVGTPTQFLVQVAGAPDTSATWSLQEGAAAGTLSSNGLYTAPGTNGTFHVVATSHADPTKSATATVTVTGTPSSTAAPVITAVSPVVNQATQTITITGSGFGTKAPYSGDSSFIAFQDQTANWEAGYTGDGVSADGNLVTMAIGSWTDTSIVVTGFGSYYGVGGWTFNAGDTVKVSVWNANSGAGPGTYTLTAGTAAPASTVTAVTVSPSAPSLTLGGTQQFTATVAGTNSPSQSVTWKAASGTITTAGVYTAPASGATDTVTATSVQNTAISGTATVTLAATAALFRSPLAVSVDSSGNVYVADASNDMIRKIAPGGVVSTLAGTGQWGSNNGPGVGASFGYPEGIALDNSGNIYVADYQGNMIRKITPDGVVSTLAGTGVAGSANGPGASATFNSPTSLAVDSSGNVYVADNGNNLIRRITPGGVVSTYAGTGAAGATNGPAATATFYWPFGVAVDSAGNVYVSAIFDELIRKITPAGVVSTLAGTQYSGSNNGPGSSATFYSPADLALDNSGNIYVADYNNNMIRKITSGGVVSTLAGTGATGSANGPAASATFNQPNGVAVDSAGNVYVADTGNNVIRLITPAGVVSTLAGSVGGGGFANN